MIAWLGKYGRGTRIFFLVLIYVAYQALLAGIRSQYGEVESQEWILVAMVFYLILFGFGRSFGNFFLLFDRFARHSLTSKEKRFSIIIASLFGCALGAEIYMGGWIQASILVAILIYFFWGVLVPRFQDAFARS